jgi:hypothetical protein
LLKLLKILDKEILDKEKLDKEKLDREKLDKEKLDKEKERRKGGKEEIIKKTLILLVKKGKQLLQGYLYALLGPLKSVHKRPSFNFASKGKQLL